MTNPCIDIDLSTAQNFVKKYNEILKEMNDLYYADSAKGYDPLSDEEKEAMSDSQIEKWENKISVEFSVTFSGFQSSVFPHSFHFSDIGKSQP